MKVFVHCTLIFIDDVTFLRKGVHQIDEKKNQSIIKNIEKLAVKFPKDIKLLKKKIK